ncbi:ECF subfamily RNA polymerase sigma-24 subunit [Oceanococcus atlanticus]|uniref:ECF subfamily RNA polymerase sigma-24 subunit n=1 Tax=Oceanococcus atlanticus TaxID=1317117 RepID=A0A1Y1SIU5_9GAMM|nr:sigma-70 family RNA polymerase sigma factor [Oceanococcus atlanticus]ORE89612.1 ECF subfamily RNA polymerase sigma-24 subunit [Oceanococcus atlanticus]
MSAPFPEQAQSLLAQVALGNRDAFRQLYEMTVAHLFPVALRILRQRDKAEEALQDAYIQIWNKAGEFHAERGSAGAWMSTIVRYRALDAVRKAPREHTFDELPDAADESDAIGRLMTGSDLQVCLDDLSEEQRRTIAMAYIEGLSHSELSERLASPLGTVKSWIRRGLQALRECLSR